MKQIRDAIVIGSGIIGSATSLALVRAGIKRVSLIEKGPLVSGMTRRNAALAHPFHGNPVLSQLVNPSFDFYNQWALNLGGKSSFVETGAAVLGNGLNSTVAVREQPEVQELSPGALAGLYPAVTPRVGAAAFTTRSGYADAVLTAQAMVNAAKDRGLQVQTGTQVKQILVNARQVTGVKTTTGELEAPIVVVAAGGWAERLLAPLGIPLRLRYRRGVVLFYEQPRETATEFPILLDETGNYFCRPHPYRMCCVGMVHVEPQAQGVDAIDEYVKPGEESTVSRFLGSCIPALGNLAPKRSHTIVYDTLADGLPAFGRVPSINGLFASVGFGTSAFSVAPAAGETLAKLIIDGSSEIDISSFDPSRPV